MFRDDTMRTGDLPLIAEMKVTLSIGYAKRARFIQDGPGSGICLTAVGRSAFKRVLAFYRNRQG